LIPLSDFVKFVLYFTKSMTVSLASSCPNIVSQHWRSLLRVFRFSCSNRISENKCIYCQKLKRNNKYKFYWKKKKHFFLPKFFAVQIFSKHMSTQLFFGRGITCLFGCKVGNWLSEICEIVVVFVTVDVMLNLLTDDVLLSEVEGVIIIPSVKSKSIIFDESAMMTYNWLFVVNLISIIMIIN